MVLAAAAVVVAVHNVANSEEEAPDFSPHLKMALSVTNVSSHFVKHLVMYLSDYDGDGFFRRICFFKDVANESDFAKWALRLDDNPGEKFLFKIEDVDAGKRYVLETVFTGMDDSKITHSLNNLVPFSAPENFDFSVETLSNALQITNATIDLNGFPDPEVELIWQQDGKAIHVNTLTWSSFINYKITGLENDVKTDVRAFAKNDFGIAQSPLLTATPTARPAAVSALSLVASDSQIVANWTDPDNGTLSNPVLKYAVKLSSAGNNDVLKEVMEGSPLTYTFDDLVNGTLYTVTVAAINIYGAGPITSKTCKPYKAPGFLDMELSDGDVATSLIVKVSGDLVTNGAIITSIKVRIIHPVSHMSAKPDRTVSLPFDEQQSFVFSDLSEFTIYNVKTVVTYGGANGESHSEISSNIKARSTLGGVPALSSATLAQADISAPNVASVSVDGLLPEYSVLVKAGSTIQHQSDVSSFDIIVNDSSPNQMFHFYQYRHNPNDASKLILSTPIEKVFTPLRKITAPTLLTASLEKTNDIAKIMFNFDKDTQFSALNHVGDVSFNIAYNDGPFASINTTETDGSFEAVLDNNKLIVGQNNSLKLRAEKFMDSTDFGKGIEASTILAYSKLPSGNLDLKVFPGNGVCALSWTELSCAGYYIRYKKTTAISYDPKDFFKIEDPLVTDYTLENLENWVEYSVEIRAYNALDEKSGASTKKFVCATSAGPVTDLVIDYNAEGTGAKLKFTHPVGNPNIRVLKYVLLNQLEYQLAASAMQQNALANAEPEIIVAGLVSGLKYALKILAVIALADGSSVYSPPLNFDLIPRKAPSNIGLELIKEYGENNNNSSLNIQVAYELNNIALDVVELYFKGQTPDEDVLAAKSVDNLFIIAKDKFDNPLVPNNEYTFRAKVLNKLGQHAFSNYFPFKLVAAVSDLDVSITPGNKKCDVALLGLDNNSLWELDTLDIEYRTGAAAFNKVQSSVANKVISSLVNGSSYEFSVVAKLKLKDDNNFKYTTKPKLFSGVVPRTNLAIVSVDLLSSNKKFSVTYSNGGLAINEFLFLVAFENNQGLVHKLTPEELEAVFGVQQLKDAPQNVVIDIAEFTTINSPIKHVTAILTTPGGLAHGNATAILE